MTIDYIFNWTTSNVRPTSAGSFVIGNVYEVLTVGTTDFTHIGGVNTVGATFTAGNPWVSGPDPTTGTSGTADFIGFKVNENGMNIDSASILFTGRGSLDWGQDLQQGLLQVMENFAGPTGPANATLGQGWFDTITNSLNINVGPTGPNWNPIAFSSDVAPIGGVYPGSFTVGYPTGPTDAVNRIYIETNYAQINGNAANTFAVNAPVGPSDAVPRGYLEANYALYTGVTGPFTVAPIVGIGSQNDALNQNSADGIYAQLNGNSLQIFSVGTSLGLLDAVNNTVLNAAVAGSALNPPGTIIAYGGSSVPPGGYLTCPPAASYVSCTTYNPLFLAIGIAWGVGGSLLTAGSFAPANVYVIQTTGNTDFIMMGAVSDTIGLSFTPSGTTPLATTAVTGKIYNIVSLGTTNWTAIGATSVNAGSFVTGHSYIIETIGTTDFIALGASGNTIGLHFTDTGATWSVGALTPTKSYKIATLGSTDFTTVGATLTNAGSFVVSTAYVIQSAGNTDFLKIAGSFVVGTIFTYSGTTYAATTTTNGKSYKISTGGNTNWGAIGGTTINAGFFVNGSKYFIEVVGNTDFVGLGAASNTVGLSFTYNSAAPVHAGSFVSGKNYNIVSSGNTSFTQMGAANNLPGTVFTYNGLNFAATALLATFSYRIVTLGSTTAAQWVAIGATAVASTLSPGSTPMTAGEQYIITVSGTGVNWVAAGAGGTAVGTIFTANGTALQHTTVQGTALITRFVATGAGVGTGTANPNTVFYGSEGTADANAGTGSAYNETFVATGVGSGTGVVDANSGTGVVYTQTFIATATDAGTGTVDPNSGSGVAYNRAFLKSATVATGNGTIDPNSDGVTAGAVGTAYDSFSIPWFPLGYTIVQGGTIGQQTIGVVLAHTHTYKHYQALAPQSGSSSPCWYQAIDSQTYGQTPPGGSANLAAGSNVQFAVKT